MRKHVDTKSSGISASRSSNAKRARHASMRTLPWTVHPNPFRYRRQKVRFMYSVPSGKGMYSMMSKRPHSTEEAYAVWERARAQYHNLRDMDRGAKLFKCFTCESWFDGGMHLDRNFNFVGTEIEQCPI